MYRYSPVRNQRSKGIKIKNVLQVCLLVAVCFWLIFLVKRSHDKRKEFEAADSMTSLSTRTPSGDEIAKLGRKDLQPKVDKLTKDGQEDEEEQDNNKHEYEEQEEHKDNKHEEEEQDEDKIDDEKDDGGGGGDDEIDENEQEKSDVEIEREEVDAIDEDKETEEETSDKENENENEEKEKDGQSQTENEVSSDEHAEDGAIEHTHEAREEHYKADDASSAVTHEGRTLGTENQIKNETSVNISENVGQTADNVISSDITLMPEKDTKPEPLVSDMNSASSVDDSLENGPPSNTTMITSESTETENVTEVQERSSNSTDITNSEVTESNEMSLDPNNETEGTEETVDPDEIQHDPIDSTDSLHLEEKDVRTDLDTLPVIKTEGGNSKDTAAE